MADERLARALRSRVRRSILKELVSRKKISVHAFAERQNLTESCASKHFKLLYDLGFLTYREQHPEKFYMLRVPEIRQLLDAYEKIVKKLQRQ